MEAGLGQTSPDCPRRCAFSEIEEADLNFMPKKLVEIVYYVTAYICHPYDRAYASLLLRGDNGAIGLCGVSAFFAQISLEWRMT